MDIRDKLSISLYGRTRKEAWESGTCIRCKRVVVEAECDPTSWFEYRTISALCPECWDEITKSCEEN